MSTQNITIVRCDLCSDTIPEDRLVVTTIVYDAELEADRHVCRRCAAHITAATIRRGLSSPPANRDDEALVALAIRQTERGLYPPLPIATPQPDPHRFIGTGDDGEKRGDQ